MPQFADDETVKGAAKLGSDVGMGERTYLKGPLDEVRVIPVGQRDREDTHERSVAIRAFVSAARGGGVSFGAISADGTLRGPAHIEDLPVRGVAALIELGDEVLHDGRR